MNLSGRARSDRYGNTKKDALVKLQYDLYDIKPRSPFLNLLNLGRMVGSVALEGT